MSQPRSRSRPSATPDSVLLEEIRSQFARATRYVPNDKFFASIEDAMSKGSTAADMRMLALREVQRSRVSVEDKITLFIPAATLAATFGVEDILHAIHREKQTAIWDSALTSLCDFVCLRGRGIRFTCTNRDLAVKLGGTSLSCMGQKLIIKQYSVYERLYFVDLTHIPSELSEDAIYDYFVELGLLPIIAPTHQAGLLTSRDRTVWFTQYELPKELMIDGQPLREIFFDGFDAPVYVHHKNRSLNKVVPPSIAEKRKKIAELNQATSDPASATTGRADTTPPPAPASPADGDITLEQPPVEAPFQSWVNVNRHALCSTHAENHAEVLLEMPRSMEVDGRCIFGFPVTPTSYELAFCDHDDDETAGDADCIVKVEDKVVSGIPTAPAAPIAKLMATRSILPERSTKMKRSEHRAKAKKAATALLELKEPEDRLAAISAQPSAYAGLVFKNTEGFTDVVRDHAVLRSYSGAPSTTHGTEASLHSRLLKVYPDGIPDAGTLLADLYVDDDDRSKARCFAIVDIFLRTHAPAIYMDPVKVKALCPDATISCHQYSDFLLWSDTTLTALCDSALGEAYTAWLPDHIRSAFEEISTASDMSDNSSDTSGNESLPGLSLNINGLNQPSLSLFTRLFNDFQLIAFQETKFSDPDKLRKTNFFAKAADAKAELFWSHRTDEDFPVSRGRGGVGVVFSGRHPFTSLKDVTLDYSTPNLLQNYLLIDASIQDFRLFIHIVYAPVTVAERKTFFSALPSTFPVDAQHLVLGDFNTPLDPSLDEATPYPHDQGRDELTHWMLQLGVLDAWRQVFPDRRQFSGPRRRNRIDYCMLSTTLYTDCLQSVRYVTDDRWHHEDHLPTAFELKSPSQPVTSRLPWKCPRWLLQTELIRRTLELTLDKLCDRIRLFPGSNPGALLDEHKRADSIFLREAHKLLKSKDQDHLRGLQAKVNECEAIHAVCPFADSSADLTAAQLERNTFQELLTSRHEAAKFDRDVTQGEKGTKHFFRPPTQPEYRVSIPRVRLPGGETTSDPDAMAAAHRNFWGEAFQSPSRDLKGSFPDRRYDPGSLQRLLQHATRRLTEQQRNSIDAPITANDMYWAIVHSPKNKSAGYDGLPAEYYQLFPSKWAKLYELIYAAQLERGRMSKFQRRAYISLLYKGGDREEPKNYRPITLLNHDAKFGPKVMAHRLRKILPHLLDPDQTGFVHGRSIRHALLRFQDLQTLAQQTGLTRAGAVLLDFAKAFDSVLWPALDMVLRHFGFGETFRAWVTTFFKGTLVSVLVNGTASKPFELGCGVRQGDPLSPALFVVFIEPMLCYLRDATGSLGITVPTDHTPHHLLAFADDCTGILRNLNDAPRFIEAVGVYANAAGLQLNVAKTHLLPFAPLDADLRQTLAAGNLHVVGDSESVRLLGVYVSPSLPTSARFPKLISDMVSRCLLWKYRARTLLGRAAILRTIVLPLLWYTAAVTTVPSAVADQVLRLCKTFLFKKKISSTDAVRAPMPQEWITWPTSRGGLGLPDIGTFSRTLHLCSLRDAMRMADQDHRLPRWFTPACSLFNLVLAGAGEGFDLLYSPISNSTPLPPRWRAVEQFWISPLRSWERLLDHPRNTTVSLPFWIEQPMWRNRDMLVGRLGRTMEQASLNSVRYISRGYVRLHDFVDRHGELPSTPLCKEILPREDFTDQRLHSLAASHFVAQARSRIAGCSPLASGPRLPAPLLAASHGWSFSGFLFIHHKNSDLYRLLHQLPAIPRYPHGALGVEEPDWSAVWRVERSLDKDVLPVLGDIKFRLQHNALGFRVKFKWHTSDVNCIHGCSQVEDARHLFWDCRVAQAAWQQAMESFSPLLDRQLAWENVVFLHDLRFTDASTADFGRHNLLRVFNMLRCSVLYPLWLHRTDRIFQGVQSSYQLVMNSAAAYSSLHLRRLPADDNP
ncbi:Pollike protein, partial [Globisporangium splendens]